MIYELRKITTIVLANMDFRFRREGSSEGRIFIGALRVEYSDWKKKESPNPLFFKIFWKIFP